jgi:hypothetical protein
VKEGTLEIFRNFFSSLFENSRNLLTYSTMPPFRNRGGRGGRGNGRGRGASRGGARFGRIEARGRNDAFQSARVVEDEE